jgi:membrane-associated phospholipid phosphatase/protein-S-isoprenylcysteine O-methyltransferase Ste14
MSTERSSNIGKALYGFLFVIALPALLIGWARLTENVVRVPAYESMPIGAAVAAVGAVVMVSGMVTLTVYGKGLPMNAYPPLRFVREGIYQLISHPIYAGFSTLCIGTAIAFNSSSGLWLVSPVVILGCVALVEGYERHDLRNRFGSTQPKPLIHIPGDETTRPARMDRLSVYVLVLAPWLILYEAVRFIGIPEDAVVAFLPFEKDLPVYEWTEMFYLSTYAFVLLAPLVARTNRDLRDFSISGLIATGLVILLFLAVPLIAPPRPFTPHGLLGRLLASERAYDTPAAAFPSFHVVWAFLAAKVYARRMPSFNLFWWAWAVLISISCITTGMHAVVDVLGGFIVVLFVTRIGAIWERTRRFTERIANSWREWRFGPVRVINHGFYAGAGAFMALSIVGTLIGPGYIPSILIIGTSILITSAIWAQVVEGSPSLLRPYGWYGGLLGAIIGASIAKLLGASPWLLLAAFTVGAPWVQSAGRLRCLVQGCCHGRPAPATIGISYTHPRSRVCKLAGLTGVPIHATPLYSILWNIVVAIIISRLWFLRAPLSLIIGIYLIITGLGRFVEESYRGEPQTAIYGGLRLYQWMAILSVISGMLATTVGGTLSTPEPEFNWASIIAAAFFGVLTSCALGLDFPESNKRFARLA